MDVSKAEVWSLPKKVKSMQWASTVNSHHMALHTTFYPCVHIVPGVGLLGLHCVLQKLLLSGPCSLYFLGTKDWLFLFES